MADKVNERISLKVSVVSVGLIWLLMPDKVAKATESERARAVMKQTRLDL